MDNRSQFSYALGTFLIYMSLHRSLLVVGTLALLFPVVALACGGGATGGGYYGASYDGSMMLKKGTRPWGPEQATGKPDTPWNGDIKTAWASETQDDEDEWLE